MRRSVNIRIVAFVLLLGMIGVIAAGCTVTVTFYWTFPRYELDAFFRSFAERIGQEDARFVFDFYEYEVYVKSEDGSGEKVFDFQIANRWLEHFEKYWIKKSNIIEIEERRPYEDKHAVVKVKRSEDVWDWKESEEQYYTRRRATTCEGQQPAGAFIDGSDSFRAFRLL